MPVTVKKTLILTTLELLRRHGDDEHHLKQTEILSIMEQEYGTTLDRKSLRRNLKDLVDMGYPVEEDHGWYYAHEFHMSELNLIADSLLYNPAVPWKQCRGLLEKLGTLASRYYEPTPGAGMIKPANGEFLFTLDVLHEAIAKRKKVSFQYHYYDVDKKLHPTLRRDGSVRVLTVSPYRIVQSGGRYYLICNTDNHDGVSHYRLDRIRFAELAKESVRPMRDVEGGSALYNMPKYLAEHPHMFSGPTVSARLRATRQMAGNILDWFGMDTRFENVTEESLEAVVQVDETSLKYWLKQYDEGVERIE